MSPEHADGGAPVPVLLEVCDLVGHQAASDRVEHAIEQALTDEIASLMLRLGVPGSPRVRAKVATDSSEPGIALRPFRLTVNEHRCRLPVEDLQRVIAYMRGTPPTPPSHRLADELLMPDLEGAQARSVTEGLVEFVCLACVEALGRAPSVLLGGPQSEVYAREVAAVSASDAPSPDPERLRQALSRVLDLRISIADRAVVADALRSSHDEQAAAEELISRLRRPAIELHAPVELLDELITDPTTDFRSSMAEFRAEVRDMFGLEAPALRLVPVNDLKPNSMRFAINDVADLPWMALRAGQCMVGAEPAALAHFEVEADPILHPAGGTASVIANADAQKADELGAVVWNRAEHLLACLAAALRAHAGYLVDRDVAEQALETFAPSSLTLVDSAHSDLEPDWLVGLLRRLVADGLSIGNLPVVLDLLLEHRVQAGAWPVWTESAAEAIPGEDAAPDAEAYVRAGMPRSTLRRWRLAPNTVELSILTVAPEVEAELREDAGRGRALEIHRDRLLDALQEELDFVPPGRGTPVLIASSRARRPLQEIIAYEFPRMGVLSRLEIPPEADIEEFGRIKPA